MRVQCSRSVLSCYQGWGGHSSSRAGACCPQPLPAPAHPADCCQAAPRLVTLDGNGSPAACMHPGHLAPSPSWARWDMNFIVRSQHRAASQGLTPTDLPTRAVLPGDKVPFHAREKVDLFSSPCHNPIKALLADSSLLPRALLCAFHQHPHTAPVQAASPWQIHTFLFFYLQT